MWYMVYEKTTGRAVSCGSVLAEPMPDQFGVAEIGEQPDFSKTQWNASTLQLEPIGS